MVCCVRRHYQQPCDWSQSDQCIAPVPCAVNAGKGSGAVINSNSTNFHWAYNELMSSFQVEQQSIVIQWSLYPWNILYLTINRRQPRRVNLWGFDLVAVTTTIAMASDQRVSIAVRSIAVTVACPQQLLELGNHKPVD